MASDTSKKALLEFDDKKIELPIYQGTLGPDVIDVSPLVKSNYFTYDPGFLSTAACESKITFIDGDKGVLLYRGYPIEQLAEHSNFLDVSHLLIYSSLPGWIAHWKEMHADPETKIGRPRQIYTGERERKVPR